MKPWRRTKEKRENPGDRNKDENQATADKDQTKIPGAEDKGANRSITDSSHWVTPSLREP